MIHSLSGGVLADNGIYTFVKVEVEGAPRWYLAGEFRVKSGDRVRVSYCGKECEGAVLRTEDCTRQTAPVPLNRAACILGTVPQEQ